MRVLFVRPDGAVVVETDAEKGEGFVFDGQVHSTHLIESILARGYWEPFEGDEAVVLKQVETAPTAATVDT